MHTLSSRIRGSLYGVAVVDALGGPVEFKARNTFPEVTRYRYNANFDLAPGTWTDDTSMTLCLAQSLVDNEGTFDAEDQIRKYIKWYRHGYMSATDKCFDIGNATRQALSIWDKTLHAKDTEGYQRGQVAIDKALNKEMSCGNGSLMRCVPIPLIYYDESKTLATYARLASQPTHPHPTCVEACQLYTHLISLILQNTEDNIPKSELFSAIREYSFASPILKATFSKYASMTSFIQMPTADISSSGFVVHTLEAALWAFFSMDGFRQGALKVVNLGDDADTVGAVYGGLAGAYYGFEEIPELWVNDLEAKNIVDSVVDGMVHLAQRRASGAPVDQEISSENANMGEVASAHKCDPGDLQ